MDLQGLWARLQDQVGTGKSYEWISHPTEPNAGGGQLGQCQAQRPRTFGMSLHRLSQSPCFKKSVSEASHRCAQRRHTYVLYFLPVLTCCFSDIIQEGYRKRPASDENEKPDGDHHEKGATVGAKESSE